MVMVKNMSVKKEIKIGGYTNRMEEAVKLLGGEKE